MRRKERRSGWLYDRMTNTTCYHQPDQKFNTASVVKVLIATAAQWRAQQQNRPLTPEEDQLVRRMITSAVDQESNDAASLLWSDLRLHGPYVNVVIALLELTDTDPADDGGWGMTETTARDQVRLMSFLTSPGEEFLARERREYVLQRMTEVPAKHRFGVPVLAPAPWHNKIGYSKLSDDDWETYFNYRTHSVGAIRGPGGTGEFDYVLVILSDRNFWARGGRAGECRGRRHQRGAASCSEMTHDRHRAGHRPRAVGPARWPGLRRPQRHEQRLRVRHQGGRLGRSNLLPTHRWIRGPRGRRQRKFLGVRERVDARACGVVRGVRGTQRTGHRLRVPVTCAEQRS